MVNGGEVVESCKGGSRFCQRMTKWGRVGGGRHRGQVCGGRRRRLEKWSSKAAVA